VEAIKFVFKKIKGAYMKLSILLREGTAEEHKIAESSVFIQSIFKGLIPKNAYTKQLECLYHLYSCLENELELNKTRPEVSSFYLPELFRTESLLKDLKFFLGNDYQVEKPLAETVKYIQHIEKISKTQPILLVPHAYVRYLGDLSGGQILGKILRKSYSLAEGEGDDFYRFPIQDVTAYKNAYREKLDNLTSDEFLSNQLLLETKLAYTLNGNMFKELDAYL
jgi:heme oxygenase (biliverdin-producing, ferredoxin)